METKKRRRYQKDLAPADDIITLIHLVRQNPALYNYKLQPNQRRRIDVLNGWAQIASQIGNKYTVEECRRKWKNLRDTYHQYRLRKCKIGDGLSKWRYAKHMEFLSTIYQPKLKSHRTQAYANMIGVGQGNLLHEEEVASEKNDDDEDNMVSEDIVHSSILSVNDTDTFILTAYEDVSPDNEVTNDGPSMVSHHNSIEECVELIKHERTTSLDEDGPNCTEVDYEEVCLYEEAGNPQSVDCETIIGTNTAGNSADSDDAKYQYIDASEFCINNMQSVTARSHYSSSGSNSVIGTTVNAKLKSTTTNVGCAHNQNVILTTPTPSTSLDSSNSVISVTSTPINGVHVSLPELTSTPNPALINAATINTSGSLTLIDHALRVGIGNGIDNITTAAATNATTLTSATTTTTATATNGLYECIYQREECDLFFDFLKKKIQRFPPEEITSIQVEFLNCVLRREADNAQKILNQQQQQVTSNNNNSNNNNGNNNNNSNNCGNSITN